MKGLDRDQSDPPEYDPLSSGSSRPTTPVPPTTPLPAKPDVNPFEAITGKVDAAEAPNPFEAITGKVDPDTTATGSFVRGAERTTLPTVLSMPLVGAGAQAGAALGAFGGPAAPITVPLGALAGGVTGALVGGYGFSALQDYALSKLPTSWLEAIGQDERQQKLDAELHGTAAFLGGVVPMALTMRFGRIPKGVLPENPTAWQKLAANPLTARAFGGAVMGGIELGSEVATEGHPNWTHTAIATGEGIFFNKPTRFGQRLLNAGARPVQGLTERAQPPEATQAAPETETGPTVAEADALGVMGPGATEATFLGTEARNPQTDQTAQQTRRDEMAAMGEHRPTPDDPGVPVEVARNLDPEAFALRDELIERRDSLRQRIEELKSPSEEHLQEPVARAEALEAELKALEAEKPSHWPRQARILRAKIREARQDHADRLEQQTAFAEGRAPDNEEVATLRQHLLATEHELWDVSKRTSAAMRSAADVTGGFAEPRPVQEVPATSETAPVPEAVGQEIPPAPAKPIEQQTAAIAADVERQLLAAGRPADEAKAAAELVAARYETRAALFKGALGTAEELYRKEGASIQGGKGTEPVPQGERQKEFAQSVPLREGTESLEPFGIENDQTYKTREIAAALEQRTREKFGTIDRKDYSDKASNEIAGWMADEVRFEMRPGNEARSGVGWYSQKFQRALDQFASIYPELKSFEASGAPPGAVRLGNTKNARDFFAALIAVTSDGSKVDSNFSNAAWSYGQFRETGRLPTDFKFGGDRNASMKANFANIERLLNDLGPRGMHEFMLKEMTVSEAKQVAKAQGIEFNVKTKANAVVPQSSVIFGPKLGAFYANLMGSHGYLTMDRWWSRTFNRYRGTLLPEVSRTGLERFRNLIGEPGLSDAETLQRVIPYRDAYFARGYKGGTEIEKAANTIHKDAFEMLEDTPFNASDREFMTKTADRAQQMLEKGGIKLSIADIQAILWYYEKRLYGELGARQTADVSYEEAARKAASKVREGAAGPEPVARESEPGRSAEDGARTAGVAEVAGPDGAAFEVDRQGAEYQQTTRGKIRIAEGRRSVITLMKDANASTFIHETGHEFLEQFGRDAAHEAAPAQLRDDYDTVLKWFGVHSAEDIKTKQHEKFARGFEQYLREGVAPTQKLAHVFDQFKQWMLRIYETLKGLGQPINDDIREVFDRMLAEHPQRSVVSPEEARGPTLTEIHEADAQHTEPHEALPVADRLMAERERATAEVPPEVQNEFAKAEADIAAKSGSGAGAPEPGGEAGAGGAGRPALGGPGGTPGAIAEGGARSAEPGAERGGGSPAPKESAGVRGGGRESPIDAVTPGPTDFLNPRRDTQFVDKAGNIRLDKIERPEEVKQVIREAAEANDDFIGDRRGVVTDQQVLDLSRALGMDFGFLQTRSIGQAFNAEQIVAARKLLVDSATNVWELMKRASTGTDEDVIAYAKAKDRHQMIQAQVSGITAEAGRALRAFRHLAGQETALGVDQFLRSATGKTLFQLKQEAKLGAQIDSPENVSKMLSDAKKRTLGYGILEAWINGLLSGTSTFMTNQVANVMLIASTIPERAVAAGIGAVRGALGGETKGTIRMGELMAMARSPALGPALKATIDTLKTGQRVLLPGEDPRDMKYFYVPTQGEVKAPVLDETMRLRDIGSYAYAAVQGTRDAVRIAAAAVDADAPLVGWHFSQLGVIPDIAVKGVPAVPLGSLVRVPSRLSAAMDSFMRSWLYGMEKSAAGYRTASDEMLSGHAFDKRIAELRTNPTEEIVQNSRKAASQGALMDSSSRFVQLFAQLTNTPVLGFPYLKFIDPFVSIGANIIDQALLKRTPIGLLSPEIRADLAGHNGKAAQDTAASRMLVGTGLAIFYMGLAAEGYLTGNAPSDAAERNIWEMTGKRAHSVLIGDMWHDISKLSPVGLHASIAADLWDAFQHGGAAASAYWAGKSDKADEELQAVATAFIHGITRTVLDQSFLRGPSDLMKAVTDSQRYGDSFVRNFTSGFIPFSSALGQTTRATDPYQRQVRTLVDAFKAKIPGYSQELLPKIDIWGEMVPNLTALGGRQFSAVYQSKVSQDPVNLAMHDLGVWKGPVGKSILGVELTPEQWTEFATIAGKTAKMRLDVMVRSADWQTYPNHVKRDVLNKYIKAARDSARGYMMMKYPSIPAEAGENKRLQHTDEED